MQLKTLLEVGVGGCLGAVARATVTTLGEYHLPQVMSIWWTFLVNFIGCFLIGVLSNRLSASPFSPVIITGFLGGFTTYSKFSQEIIQLLQTGQASSAITYVGATVFMCSIATYLGCQT
ncbi:MAG: CrcB family protein [Zetaproteobacteria bacterium]|nr:CrcB family protein [Zetaproteobacteria bacterium]